MNRLTAILFVGFLTLPIVAAAQDAPEWDKLGKERVRLFDSAADDAQTLAKDPKVTNDMRNELDAKYQKQAKELDDRVNKLSPEHKQALQEKYGEQLKRAAKRLADANIELAKALPEEESIEKIKERLEQNLQKARELLNPDNKDAPKDAVEKAIELQEQNKKDFDELRRRKNEGGGGGGKSGDGQSGNGQSGQSGNGQSGDGQTGKGKPKDKGMGDGQEDKKDDKQNPMKDDPMGKGKDDKKEEKKDKQDKKGKGGDPGKKEGPNGGGLGGKGEEGKLDNPDLKSGFWGKLADTKRTEMEIYAKDRFMRRYEEQLRQYYRAIAEQK